MDPTSGQLAPASTRPRWLVPGIVTAVIVAVAITATLIFVHWRNGLKLFEPAGNQVGADHLRVGQTFYVPSVYSPTESTTTLTITSMNPVVTTDTSHATIEVLACTPRPGLTEWLGDAYSLQKWCSATRPFKSGRYELGAIVPRPPAVVFITAVTPRTKGHVHVAGVRVKYQRGLRRGDQRVGFEVDTRTP